MLYLVTGTPGAGKTLYTVSELAKQFAQRSVYYYRIPQLTLSWTKLDDPTEWQSLPDGSVVIVDEAHESFPSRDYRKSTPEYIEGLAVHRHRGFDLVFITQHPKDLDQFIRRRVGRHIHVEKPLMRSDAAKVFIWPKYIENPEPQQVRNQAELIKWKYPEEAFGIYKSAVEHNVPKPPMALTYTL